MFNYRIFKISIILSLLIHLILIISSAGYFVFAESHNKYKEKQNKEEKLITFDLTSIPDIEPKEVIETPSSAEIDKPTENAKYLSDKNTQAQSLVSPPENNKDKESPFAEGKTEVKDIITSNVSQPSPDNQKNKEIERQKNGEPEKQKDEKQENHKTEETENPKDDGIERRSIESKKAENKESIVQPSEQGFTIPFKNLEGGAIIGMGDISFSANFSSQSAYAIKLKEKIRPLWISALPPSFKMMGLYWGTTIVKFTIHRDGTISNITLLKKSTDDPEGKSRGHNDLDVAAMESIRWASPVPPLPLDLKEKTLEVTFKFICEVYRE